jgi:putative FmdB family regulatory protein
MISDFGLRIALTHRNDPKSQTLVCACAQASKIQRGIMPIYEYRCADCRKKVSVFFRTLSAVDHSAARCPTCGGKNLTRLVSRVRALRSEEGRLDSLADESALAGLDENDPKSMGRWMRKMAAESGEGMPPEFDEVVGRLESGQDPESIEKSMPELAEAAGGEAGAGEDF